MLQYIPCFTFKQSLESFYVNNTMITGDSDIKIQLILKIKIVDIYD